MWYIYTIICIINIPLQPFCIYGGKIPVAFADYDTCDMTIDDIVETVDRDLKQKQISLLMKCLKDEQITT
tara:strand:- start:646 stop:855 length:210 start_codon:yes stop_codon:yes gene_type:complete